MAGLPDAKEAQGRKDKDSSDPAPQSRDFFWDSITLYIVGAILALTAIDVVSEYVRGSNVQCYQPNETDSSLLATVQNYVNELCSGHVPPLKFLPSFIAIHAVSILVLHYVWLNAYGADLDFFFRHVYKLERNRQPNTGDYPAINHTISREMEEAFGRYGRPNGMYWSYIIKVLFQLFLCVLGIFLVPLVFFKYNEQNVTFQCPGSESDARGDSWPLPDRETVICVFSPIDLLRRIWLLYLFLLVLAAVFMVTNLIQLTKWHTAELGFENCADFSFQTGLSYHYFHPKPKLLVRDLLPYPTNSPYKIHSDYDFLMVKLFRTDGGLAYIMRDVHVSRLLQEKSKTDLSKVALYRLSTTDLDDKSKEFVRAETGWSLSMFTSDKHVPALDEKVLLFPPSFRGILMGCALRCEGGYRDIKDLNELAKRCLMLANGQLVLANELVNLVGGDNTVALLKKAESFQREAEGLSNEVARLGRPRPVNRKEKQLTQAKEELEVLMSTMARATDLQTSTESFLKKTAEPATAADGRKVKDINVERGREDEGAEVVLKKGDASAVSGAEPVVKPQLTLTPQQLQVSSQTCTLLDEVANSATQLQVKLLNLEKDIKAAKKYNKNLDDTKTNMMSILNNLIGRLLELRHEQQAIAKDQKLWEILLSTLKLSGPHLMGALVIGFDMESQGISSALARLFLRVGFINFSSHYADYDTPLKVVNKSYYLFNVTTPADIFTYIDPTSDKGEPNRVFDDLPEIWYWNRNFEDERIVTNFIVVGPVSNHMHVVTVNRLLSKYQQHLSPHAIIMTIYPQSISGRRQTFQEYIPPTEYKDFPPRISTKNQVYEWRSPSFGVGNIPSSPIQLTVDVGDTTFEFSFKLYRRFKSD